MILRSPNVNIIRAVGVAAILFFGLCTVYATPEIIQHSAWLCN